MGVLRDRGGTVRVGFVSGDSGGPESGLSFFNLGDDGLTAAFAREGPEPYETPSGRH